MTHEFSHLRAVGAAGGIVADPTARPAAIEADAIVTFLTEGGIGSGTVAEIDRATGGLLSKLTAAGVPYAVSVHAAVATSEEVGTCLQSRVGRRGRCPPPSPALAAPGPCCWYRSGNAHRCCCCPLAARPPRFVVPPWPAAPRPC